MVLKGSVNFGPRGSTALGFGGHAHRAFPIIFQLMMEPFCPFLILSLITYKSNILICLHGNRLFVPPLGEFLHISNHITILFYVLYSKGMEWYDISMEFIDIFLLVLR